MQNDQELLVAGLEEEVLDVCKENIYTRKALNVAEAYEKKSIPIFWDPRGD
jgi:hypothetical protein